MKTIAVMQEKGGVGKTTTAASIAYILGEERERSVLVIDGDQQGNISKLFGAYDPEGAGTAELLDSPDEYSAVDLIAGTPYHHIQILPGNGYIMDTNISIARDQEAEQVHRLKNALVPLAPTYDFVICDCGLVLDMTVLNILAAADIIIAPVKFGGFENDALLQLAEHIVDMQGINTGLHFKALLTMRQKNRATEETERWLKEESGFDVFQATVRQSVVVGKATASFLPVPKYAKNCIAAKDYRQVTDELLKSLEERNDA